MQSAAKHLARFVAAAVIATSGEMLRCALHDGQPETLCCDVLTTYRTFEIRPRADFFVLIFQNPTTSLL
ncbi:hypothetical protein SAMN04515668_4116 [Hymenobacter arizonensis]|uniref:Uncharacterized protein n=1 Tax=Hymenobacter arizonensis TaxID=1227077 RepID=A0A1I6B047_HYMAR|nr:hypothetical protein SAMN04515668_4116 [Hymenobacter arizonensis]